MGDSKAVDYVEEIKNAISRKSDHENVAPKSMNSSVESSSEAIGNMKISGIDGATTKTPVENAAHVFTLDEDF